MKNKKRLFTHLGVETHLRCLMKCLTTTKCHHQSGGGINQQTTAIGCKMRDERWEMADERELVLRPQTLNFTRSF